MRSVPRRESGKTPSNAPSAPARANTQGTLNVAEQQVPHDWFEMMQKLWNPMSFSMPGMMAPTASIEEIDKKIRELKSVEAWLTMNVNFIQMTVKTLELQKTTLETLRASAESTTKNKPE